MSNIKKKIKIRQGHRVYLTKILGNADDIVQNYDGNQEKKLKQIRITLKERLDTLKTLDEEILELIEADEEISTEIEEAGKYRESVHEMIVNIDSVLEAKPMNETMSMSLRRLYDQIEAHVRGLKSLDVPDTEYGALLLPILIGKIPDEIRILLGRKMTGESWNLNTLLENFREELENRERCEGIQALSFRDGRNFNEQRGGRKYSNTPFTAAALMTGKTTINCSFCQKEHTSASCFVVTDIEARKQILRKQGRCFLCLKRNHIARDCES
ncbi:Hypothetical predicted protein, partial [Paramuricea clavata]